MNFRDHLGRSVDIPSFPKRIVSLCPSQTETLLALGLNESVVGRTRFCIHPDSIGSIEVVGGTKKVRFETIDSLDPDLIIGEKEENTAEMVAELEKKFPVYITDVKDIDSALRMIRDLGVITGADVAAEKMADGIGQEFRQLNSLNPKIRVAYFIWKSPYMVAGRDTFINSILERCGFENVFAGEGSRYPEITKAKLKDAAPDILLLSSEPFPFKQVHVSEVEEILPGTPARIVDGEMFSWYGVRMKEMPRYFNNFFKELEAVRI